MPGWPCRLTIALACVSLATLTGCRRSPPEIRLQVTLQADGSLALRVEGPASVQAAVSANRPWRGEDQLHAGLSGLRCPDEVSDEDRVAGAGLQLVGTLGPEPLLGSIPAAKVAALPSPLAFQAIAADQRDGNNRVCLSNAFLFESSSGAITVRPYPASWGVLRALASALPFVLVPLVLLVMLRRWRPRHRLLPWLLPALIAGAVWVRTAAEALVPLWPPRPTTEIEALDREFPGGFPALLDAVHDLRREAEPVEILVPATMPNRQRLLASHLLRLIPAARILVAGEQRPAPGLIVQLSSLPAAAPADEPGLANDDRQVGVLLRQLDLASVRRLEAGR